MGKEKSPETPRPAQPDTGEFVYDDEADRAAEATYSEDHDTESDNSHTSSLDVLGTEAESESMYDPETEIKVSTITNRYQGFIKNKDGEPQLVDLRKVSVKTRPIPQSSSLVVKPVVPAVIKQDRRRPPVRDYKTILAFGDAQIGYRRVGDEMVPLHDESAISAAVALARHLRPDVVVDLGDTTDFAELSRFPADSDHFQGTLQSALQRTHDLYAEFTAVTKGADRIVVDSNHTKRLSAYILKNAAALYNIKADDEKYPTLSYPGLIKLDKVGWDFIGGYEGAEYEYADDLAFIHGRYAVSNGSTASKLSKDNHDRNIVQGHKHSIESHWYTDRKGKKFGAFVVGALCRIDGVVPSYHSSVNERNQPNRRFENWQNGVMVIRDYGEGHYQFDQVPINDGVIRYNGNMFVGGVEAE